MSRSRIVRPDTVTLPISEGDTITIKRRLSAGDRLDALQRMYRDTDRGRLWDPVQSGMALMLAYLVDWTLVNEDGSRLSIAGKSAAELEAILRLLYFEDFAEIRDAINAHDDAMAAERAEQKKTLSTVSVS